MPPIRGTIKNILNYTRTLKKHKFFFKKPFQISGKKKKGDVSVKGQGQKGSAPEANPHRFEAVYQQNTLQCAGLRVMLIG